MPGAGEYDHQSQHPDQDRIGAQQDDEVCALSEREVSRADEQHDAREGASTKRLASRPYVWRTCSLSCSADEVVCSVVILEFLSVERITRYI